MKNQTKKFYEPPTMCVKRKEIDISKVKAFINKIKDAKPNKEIESMIKDIESEIMKIENTDIPCRKGGPFDGPDKKY